MDNTIHEGTALHACVREFAETLENEQSENFWRKPGQAYNDKESLGLLSLMDALVEVGVDIVAQDKNGDTAIDLMRRINTPQALEVASKWERMAIQNAIKKEAVTKECEGVTPKPTLKAKSIKRQARRLM